VKKVGEFTLESMGKVRIMALTFLFLGIGMIIVANTDKMVDTSVIGFGSRVLLLCGATAASIAMHEGLHGIFFKKFTGKVRFGFKLKTGIGPVFYATSEGSKVSKHQFWAIALAPQIGSAVLIALLFAINASESVRWFLFCMVVINFLGGAMDMYMVFWLRRFPKNALVEDTKEGAVIWQP